MAPDRRGRPPGSTSEESAPKAAPLARVRMRLVGWWRRFTHWRRTRPFWAGFITLLAAYELIAVPNLRLGGITIQQGIAGIATWLMAALMALMALVMWFQPHLRVIAGVSTILFALASFLTSNLGGFLLGMLLGLVGGSLAVAWDFREPKAETPAAPAVIVDGSDERDEESGLDLVRPDDERDAGYRPVTDQPTQPQPRVLPGGGEQRDGSLADMATEGQFADGAATR